MLHDFLFYVSIFLLVLALEQTVASIAPVMLVMLFQDLLVDWMIFNMSTLSLPDLLVKFYLFLASWSSLSGHLEAVHKGFGQSDIEYPDKCFNHYI